MIENFEPTPAAAKKPMSKTVRRAIIGSTVAVVAGAGAVATFTGAAFAAETPSTDTTTSSSAAATPGTGDAAAAPAGDAKGGARGERGGMGGRGHAVQETSVVKAADGTITTELRVTGEVTAVSATSVTIKGADGSTTTYSIPADVTVAATVKVGATVDAHGTVAGEANTLKHIHVEGEKPAAGEMPAADATARPTRLHSTAIVADPANEGKFITRTQQTGTVTAVSATSITVKSDDDFSATYTIPSSVTTTAKVGDKIGVAATQSGETNTVERIATGDQLNQLGGGKGGPRGERGDKGGMGGRGHAVQETSVVKAADGTITTELRVTGEVTAVSATSVTIKGADGSTTTYSIPADVTVAATVKVGATVDAHGTVAGEANTLKHIHVEGEKPAAGEMPAADATARPTRLHSTAIVADPANEGKFITRTQQTGTVTAVSATSITVKSDDDFSATYTIPSSVTTTAKVGDKIGVAATQSGETNTVERIATGDQLNQLGGGKGGPRGERGGRGGAPAADAPAADATGTAPAASPASTSTQQTGANVPAVTSLV